MAEEDTALVPTGDSTHAVPDTYEREYMAGAGRMLARGRRKAPAWMQLLLSSTGVTGLVMTVAGLVAANPELWITGLAMMPFGLVLWALFSVLRINVSEGLVHVQYGLFGPKIPIPSILEATAVDYDPMRFGGWGIKRSMDGEWIYNMPGDNGRAVRIVWRDKGKVKITNIGIPDPERIVAAIHEAQRALPAGESPAALSE